MADIPALVFKDINDANKDGYVYENSSCELKLNLKNYAGTALGVASITTATLTLIDRLTGDKMVTGGASPVTIEDLDVKSGLDANGLLTWHLDGESNRIVSSDDTIKIETHIAIFKFTGTYNGNTVKLTQPIKLYVKNAEKV